MNCLSATWGIAIVQQFQCQRVCSFLPLLNVSAVNTVNSKFTAYSLHHSYIMKLHLNQAECQKVPKSQRIALDEGKPHVLLFELAVQDKIQWCLHGSALGWRYANIYIIIVSVSYYLRPGTRTLCADGYSKAPTDVIIWCHIIDQWLTLADNNSLQFLSDLGSTSWGQFRDCQSISTTCSNYYHCITLFGWLLTIRITHCSLMDSDSHCFGFTTFKLLRVTLQLHIIR